jgi:hypothetical protein
VNTWGRRHGRALAVLALYCATSVALFGWRIASHPGRGIVGILTDPEIYIWSAAWWAHALQTFTNPFVSHAAYYPVGANLMWTATAPGLGLALVPLTLLFGPTAAYNIAIVLLPGLAAWTAFLLCRYVSGSTWGSIAGGYLFGFSSFVVAHLYGGDPNLTPVLAPLAALVVLQYVRADLRARGLVWRLGLILAIQFAISTELALTMTLALAVGLALAFAVAPESRSRIASSVAAIAGAYAAAIVLAAPFVYYTLTDLQTTRFVPVIPDSDILNFVVPTHLIAAGGSAFSDVTRRFATSIVDSDLYIGIPTLAMVVLYGWRKRRAAGARFLLTTLVVAGVLALGASLRYEGHRVLSLPWTEVAKAPFFGNVIPGRLIAYGLLSVSVIIALWVSSSRRRVATIALPALALLSIFPATWRGGFVTHPVRPEFFAHRLYKICIPRGETLVVFPYGRFGDSMLYQAESGFWFSLAEGNLGRDTYPPKFVFADDTVNALQFYWYGPGPLPTMAALKTYAKRRHVDRVVTLQTSPYPDSTQMNAFGPLQIIGGVYVSPACGYDSLAGDTRRIKGQ